MESLQSNEVEEKTSQEVEERLRLLQLIHDRSGNAYRSWHREELRSLRAKYNRIVISQRESRRGPCIDPLSALPVDIWAHIIDEIIYCSWGTAYRVVANMVLVNSKWRDAIVRTPRFWALITINRGFGELDLSQRLQTALALSKDQLLTIYIEHPISQSCFDNYAAMLSPHAQRIRRIVFRHSLWMSQSPDPLTSSVHQMLSELLPLPHLEGIQFNGRTVLNGEEWNIIESIPTIKVLDGDAISALPLSLLRRVPLVNLESLTFSGTVLQLFTLIRDLPRLKALTMTDPPTHETASEETQPTSLTIEPINIRTLDWKKRNGAHFRDLLHRSSLLRRLTLSVSWRQLTIALEAMEKLPSLSNLSINLISGPTEDDDYFSPTTVIHGASVQELNLSVTSYATRYWAGDSTSHNSKLSHLADSLLPVLEQLRKLTIYLTNRWTIPPVLLSSSANLQVLDLTLLGLDPDTPLPDLTLNTLENLALTVPPTCFDYFLSSFKCPNLLLLMIRGTESNPGSTVTTRLQPEQFLRLSSLHWASSNLAWNITAHNALRSITFQYQTPQTASDFCAHLIVRPRDFPSLEEIKFYCLPEWDLLFLMLERRNFLLDQAISKITTVILSTTVGAMLKGPLVSLLRGEYTNRLSNHDLSILGVGEVYFDTSLLSTPSMWSNCRAEPVTASPDPPLPDSILDLLNQRQTRYDYWKECLKTDSTVSRRADCDSLKASSLYAFTEFSMVDPPRYESFASAILEPILE
ncbi:hypothetical protein FRC17_010348 [Serendipita sp. 399]|nr:hypothetical protein FRC17_010348 [Serendipita sp. 399]